METPTTVVVQRVAVWWPPERRGAEAATVRTGLPAAFPLPHPTGGAGPLVVHDVSLTDENGYRPVETFHPTAETLDSRYGLYLVESDGLLTVHRRPVGDAFPRRPSRELFRIPPEGHARYRANYRFNGCSCSPRWRYALWTFNIGFGVTRPDVFVGTEPLVLFDEQVSLYGGRRRGHS